MMLRPREWAEHSIDDFSFSFLNIHRGTVTIEVFLHDQFLTSAHFISAKTNREAAIEDAISWAREVVKGYIQTALKAREAEIGPVLWAIFEQEECNGIH